MTRVLEDLTGLPPTYLRAAPDFHTQPLDGTIAADVACGGGYTGLSTALHLRHASLSVAVLEARIVGWGGWGARSVRWFHMQSTIMSMCCAPSVPSMASA